MSRFRDVVVVWILFVLFAMPAIPAKGQGSAPPPPNQPGTSGPPASSTTRGSTAPSRRQQPSQMPSFLSGRVVLDTGKPVPEPVSVEMSCGARTLQVIRTDLGGYFTFSFGAGSQGNVDFSASSGNPTGFGTTLGNTIQNTTRSLYGCELRVMVPGYHPLTAPLTQQMELGQVNVGTLRLRRLENMSGSAISVTSLLVPDKAKKEYEKALKDRQNNHTESALKHLKNAIELYDKYAAAWNELGQFYLAGGEPDKSVEAFQKAIESDPQYFPPYLSLATLQIQQQEWYAAVETAGRVLEMDSSVGFASFLQGIGNFNLNRLDAAEQSARQAERGPHENIPQVHALLADILLRKQNYEEAAKEIRAYLQEAPEGQLAGRMKENLARLEAHFPNLGNPPTPPSKPGS